MATQSILNTLASAFNTLLALATEIAMLVIALTTVRARRPDAAMPFVAAAGVSLFATLLTPVLYSFILPMASGGIDSRLTMSALFNVFLGLLRAAAWGAILFGIVKLASPSSPPSPFMRN